jgi:hypothetical protein
LTDSSGRKRRFRDKGRVEVRWKAAATRAGSDSAAVEVVVTDLGMGGASLESTEGWPSGTSLVLEVDLPERSPLVLPAIVRWSGEPSGTSPTVKVGVAFEDLEPRLAAELAEVLSVVPQIRDLTE